MNNSFNNLRFSLASTKYFKEDYIQKISKKDILSYANMLLENKFSVGYSSIPTIQYDRSNIDWEFWDFKHPVTNTFLLYAYGLRPVYLLTKAFEISEDFIYFRLAYSLIKSFHSYLFFANETNPFTHNDHAIVERVENLVYFGHIAKENRIRLENCEIIYNLLVDCRKWLFDDSKYQYRHNHGIISDKGLIIAAHSLNDEQSHVMIDHAVMRLKDQIAFAYGPDGVHLENSIDYHITATNQIRAIYNFLKILEHPFSIELKLFLEKTINFMVYAYKPNVQRPLFGDSKGKMVDKPDNIDALGSSNLLYIKSKGEKGEKPQNRIHYFPYSGYVFLREHFNKENYSDSTWVSLKAGYKSRIHKHQDDLSICLYSKGFDIFVDAGMYNYMYGNKINFYMDSMSAHSTVGLLDTSYSIAKNNGESFVIQKVEQKKDYDYVLASSRVYGCCPIYRHLFYYPRLNVIIIYDEIFSNSEKSFVQYFHLSPHLQKTNISKNRSVFNIGDSGYVAIIKQLNSVDELNILSGIGTRPMSVISTGFSQYKQTESLQYIKKGKHTNFICAIEIKPKEFANSHELDITTSSEGKIFVNNTQLTLPRSNPVKFVKSDITTYKNTIKIRNYQPDDEDYKYALYIFNHDTKQVVDKMHYIKNSYIDYTFPDSGKFDLMYFVSNDYGEKIKGIIASIFVDKKTIRIEKEYKKLHRPIVKEIKYRKINNRKYKFYIPMKYDFTYKSTWWVYCEGVNVHYEVIKDSNNFLFKFKNAGMYVIMCKVSDKYFGEFYFGKSCAINIEK